jgi:phosphoribosylformimino-5-aminoimidazole carboxamide ribotide isomerase
VADVRIIPVLDLMRGKVVHAVGGEREKYGPLKSVLTDSSDPLSVAAAFGRLGLKELYIADLDAIISGKRDLDLIGRIASESGMELMLDAGFRRAEDVGSYVRSGIKKIVLATETLEAWEEVSKVVRNHGARVVASIDTRLGRVVTSTGATQPPLEELIDEFEARGASELLILSLDRVGRARGVDYQVLKRALKHAGIPVLVGGGIKDVGEIRYLGELGVSGVLIATALHKGAITKEELDRLITESFPLINRA